MKDGILIMDFGSQYTHLIKARLSDLGVYSFIMPADLLYDEFKIKKQDFNLKGIILSGGAYSVCDNQIQFDKKWVELGFPVLGICYGHQLLASLFNAEVKESKPEYGKEEMTIITQSELLKGVPKKSVIWMSHKDTVTITPKKFVQTALTSNSSNTAIENSKLKLYGIQFHPEVSHTEGGMQILKNFTLKICKVIPVKKWTPELFFKETAQKYKEIVGKERIIFGLSGGVDSMTMATLLRKTFTKNKLVAIYIDSGLMPDETVYEVSNFCELQDIFLVVHNASEIFFKELKGITNPIEKGKIIGRIFIEEFEKIAKKEKAEFFAQGTIWSDVIESGVTKFSSQIKPHHNVGGLPEKMDFQLIEPIRELFKDKVRELATYFNLPENIVNKKVFPGPGFAIRVDGEVTREKVSLVRKCTKIIEDVVCNSEINSKIWMAFAILINVNSLGVKGDQRIENRHAIVVRVVESKNSMTVNFSQNVYPYLEEISSRIVKETEIGRVVYDITNKPPATIEWQ
ncbi:MAG: Glutamine-hydrolyzing GMP synthase [Candidatus Daviesbacteria bacterium GW2011_GWF2_38_7]|nr:MAG: Glutamine-hydrolyzing GMP synthase [Candidatus Daviesbacteria bacterium GW2011_GWF2_38_7]